MKMAVIVAMVLLACGFACAEQEVIWSQPPTGPMMYTSQDFEVALDNYDCMGADDVLFEDASYRIDGIQVVGSVSGALPNGYWIRIFVVLPDGAPGEMAYETYAPVPGPDMMWTFSEPFIAEQGVRYAVSVQADLPYGEAPGNQWYWQTSAPVVGNVGKWSNPGNGFGYGPDWVDTTIFGDGALDYAFDLIGERLGPPPPEVVMLLPNDPPYVSNTAGIVPLQAYDTNDTGAVVETVFEYYDPFENGPFPIYTDTDPSETTIDASVPCGEGRGWYTEWDTTGLTEGWYTVRATMRTSNPMDFGQVYMPLYIDPMPMEPVFETPQYEQVFWIDSFFDVYTSANDVVACEFVAQQASRVFTRNAELKVQSGPSCFIYSEAAVIVDLVRQGKVTYPGLIKADGTIDPAVQAALIAELAALKKYDPTSGTRPSDAENGMAEFLRLHGTSVEVDIYYDHWYDDMDFEEVKDRFEDSRTLGAVLVFYSNTPPYWGHAVSLTSVHEPAGASGTGYKLDFMDSRDGKIHTVVLDDEDDDTFTDWDTGQEVEIGSIEILRNKSSRQSAAWFPIGVDTDPSDGWGIAWGPGYADPGIYFVRAIMTDATGFTAEVTTVVIIPDTQSSLPDWFKPMWTMFSVPLQPLDENPIVNFPVNPTNRLFRWEPTQTWNFFDPGLSSNNFGLELGEGYMFSTNMADPPFGMTVTGTRQYEDFVAVIENQGRVLFGCPFIYDVPWAQIEVSEDHNTYFPLSDSRAWTIVNKHGVYWDNDLRTWAIVAPDSSGNDTMMRTWRGYWLWAEKGHVFIRVPKQ